MTTAQNTQRAPYPDTLSELVQNLAYKPHWEFSLDTIDRGQGSEGLTLVVTITTPDSYNPERLRTVLHYFPVPPAAYDQRSWRRWLVEQVLLVETHECMEFFRFVHRAPGGYIRSDGTHADEHIERPYAPSHGPGNDPYMIREVGTRTDQRTSYRGEVTGTP